MRRQCAESAGVKYQLSLNPHGNCAQCDPTILKQGGFYFLGDAPNSTAQINVQRPECYSVCSVYVLMQR